MSKKPASKMLVHQLSSVLPDDRPITSIRIIEDVEKCPTNFKVVSRTYDQDTDADLWRESGLFIKKKGRYICFSKTEGLAHSIVEDVVIINERESPPEGYRTISHTLDSIQKAWRKKQLCYKLRDRELCSKAVTDIIICSRIVNKAPQGFVAAGMINGVCVCYKTIDIVKSENTDIHPYANINLFQNVSPNPTNGISPKVPPQRPPRPKISSKPINGIHSPSTNSDFSSAIKNSEALSPNPKNRPTRPAPQPPVSPTVSTSIPIYGTLPGSSDLDGVPFVLNPRLKLVSNSQMNNLPIIKIRTQQDLDKEYFYDFRVERET
ncbi:multivesicular body subunit 12B [Prorops nasuta]|uniref:multivesicular body subunit 12B n=1 Tax=Prorops nasuta TaxID=863751 RepID=UPI0034CE7669